jgi:hypothetical protein
VLKVKLTLMFMLLASFIFFLGCIMRYIIRRRQLEFQVEEVHPHAILLHAADESPLSKNRSNSLKDEGEKDDVHSKHQIKDVRGDANEEGHPRQKGCCGCVRSLSRWTLLFLSHPMVTWRVLRGIPAFVDFKQRYIHSQLILLSIFYLRISTLFFKAFKCEMASDSSEDHSSTAVVTSSLYLTEDLQVGGKKTQSQVVTLMSILSLSRVCTCGCVFLFQTRCYEGDHLQTVAGASILLLVYTLGFPFFCFVLLMRSFTDHHTTGILGWLRRKVPILRGTGRPQLRKLIVQEPSPDVPPASPSGHRVHPAGSFSLNSPLSSTDVTTAWNADDPSKLKVPGAFAPSGGPRATGWAIDTSHWEVAFPLSSSATTSRPGGLQATSSIREPLNLPGGSSSPSTNVSCGTSVPALVEAQDSIAGRISAASSLYDTTPASPLPVEPTKEQLQTEREAEYGECSAVMSVTR